MSYKISHIEIIGKDAKALQTFYEQLFGWSFDFIEEMQYGNKPGEASEVSVGVGVPEEGQTSHVTFYVAVPDMQATLDKATELGGAVVTPPTEIPDMVTYALFTDPEGHLIGIVKEEM